MRNFVAAAIDIGTTSVKAAVITPEGRMLGLNSEEVPCKSGSDGSVVQDAEELFAACCRRLKSAVEASGVNPSDVCALSCASQRAVLICVGSDGKPLAEAISWQDMRCSQSIQIIRKTLSESEFRRITGLRLSPVFTIGKLIWLKQNEPELFKKTSVFAGVNDFVLKSFGAENFFADYSNASLTGAFDVLNLRWSDELTSIAGAQTRRFPELIESGTVIGRVSETAAALCGLKAGTPIVAGGGDQQCAGIGANAAEPGNMAITVGTAATVLTGCREANFKGDGRLTLCRHAAPGTWEMEGLLNSAGSAVAWAKRLTGREEKDLHGEAASDDPYFFPYLAGSASPDWFAQAEGAFVGLTLSSDGDAALRAAVEGVAFEIKEIADSFEAAGLTAANISAAGGLAKSETFIKLLAAALDKEINLIDAAETTLLGAAALAFLGAGVCQDAPSASRALCGKTFKISPEPPLAERCKFRLKTYREIKRRMADGGIFRRADELYIDEER